jgi:hypothetical protein
MRTISQWLAVNAFLLVMYLIGTGAAFIGGEFLEHLGADPRAVAYGSAALAVAALVFSYYAGKFLHARLSRHQ